MCLPERLCTEGMPIEVSGDQLLDKLGYNANVFRPSLSGAYNPDDGILLGRGS